jgi:hypothetical protein
MIVNPESISNTFRCNKKLADYLIYKGHLPLLSISGRTYYFAKTCSWAMSIIKLPFYWKMYMRLGLHKI